MSARTALLLTLLLLLIADLTITFRLLDNKVAIIPNRQRTFIQKVATTNWQRFQDQSIPYSFLYPADWIVHRVNYSDEVDVKRTASLLLTPGIISIVSLPSQTIIPYPYPTTNEENVVFDRMITVGDKPAREVEFGERNNIFTDEKTGKFIVVYTNVGQKTYRFQLNDVLYQPQFETLLTTLQFK